ncbi:FAD-dependent monooxygenase [Kutzneria sp. NPDC052558]|uniref:FAD-dependent monooxygenase n=1 Tax=Kutzneria sp. NPDC052558 TaxID=3364121 RepID=UPI0037CBC984
MRGKILISGASVAGPVLAYWLHRYGFEVTVVEKAATVRSGGYPIDIRGTALGVVERMGILPELRAANVDTRTLTFLNADGSRVATVRNEVIAGGVVGRDLEIRRGDLTSALYNTVRDDVEFVFNDSIATLDQHEDRVDVTFHSGARRTFDLVIGADGLHSGVRNLVFGPEEQFHRYLGYCFAGFTVPNDLGLSHEGVIWNTPGRAGILYAVRDEDQLHGFLSFARPEPPFEAFRDPAAQRELVASMFPEQQWEIPRLVAEMRTADDLFFDIVSQIHLPRWSSGRVALTGDAAHAPSFLSGQGTSIALVGAYMLAGALATNPDHTSAFAAYERDTREFAELNQALATEGSAGLLPATAEILAARNEALRAATTMPTEADKPAYSALVLPDFEPVLSR